MEARWDRRMIIICSPVFLYLCRHTGLGVPFHVGTLNPVSVPQPGEHVISPAVAYQLKYVTKDQFCNIAVFGEDVSVFSFLRLAEPTTYPQDVLHQGWIQSVKS